MPIQEVKKTNAQHAIPQNFMDVEFKIIGSLTMRQFIYLLVFFGFAYAVYSLGTSPFRMLIVLVLVFFGLGFAFVPLEERGLDEWIVNFFRSIYSPSQRVWRKEPELLSAFMGQNMEVVNQELITLAPTSSRRKLEEYLHSRDAEEMKPDALDIPESYYTEKVRLAFSSESTASQTSTPKTSETKPETEVKDIPSQGVLLPAKGPKVDEEIKTVKDEITSPVETSQDEEDKKKHIKRIPSPTRKSEIALSPLTPDRHSGRRFVDLTPGRGHIVLPIRGERTIRTSDELNSEAGIQEKTAQLQQLLSQLRAGTPAPTRNTIEPTPLPEKEKVYKDVVELKKEVKEESEREEGKSLENPFVNRPTPTAVAPTSSAKVDVIPTRQMSAASPIEVPETDVPNVVYGVVKGPSGNSLSDVVLIIKDDTGSPVRAVKTNSLGQFSISSPLSDGKYTVEVDSTKKTGFSFDIISVPLVGGVLPPMEVLGK